MIIDFHTHTFPEQIVKRAIAKLSESAHIKNYLDGTKDDLKASMQTANIDYSVLLPVVTKPAQQADINQSAILTNERFRETGILSFGGIHPDNENYRQILRELAAHQVRGIKLHPVFQETFFDDIRYLRIMDCASENGLVILTHAGYDISFPEQTFVTPDRIISALKQVRPDKLVLAHMGGWGCWEQTEELLSSYNVFLDTSFCLTPLRGHSGQIDDAADKTLERSRFLHMVKTFGAKRILFGSDSPWADQKESLTAIRESGLSSLELQDILGNNAVELLQIPNA